jgi:hypothetical protein
MTSRGFLPAPHLRAALPPCTLAEARYSYARVNPR